MGSLLDKSEHRELLENRDTNLTRGQRNELRTIEQHALQLEALDNCYPEIPFQEGAIDKEKMLRVLQNRYREILSDERPSRIDRLIIIISKISALAKHILN